MFCITFCHLLLFWINTLSFSFLSSLSQDPQNSSRNRGYAFIEYYNHACAEYSRKKMSLANFKLDSNVPTVSWADPRSGDSPSSSQVITVSA